MKIAIIGYGKMGRMVEQCALARHHEIVTIIDKKWPPEANNLLSQADVCIDFSTPESAFENIQKLTAIKANIVMGTTGWTKHLDEVKQLVQKANTGFIYSPNFSIGVAIFLQAVRQTAATIAPHKQYSVAGIEIHHAQKLDSPSGTALAITSEIAQAIPEADVQFSSVRVGSVPGTHTVIFDSPADTITLTHTARSREGFAEGAVTAAEWLQGKKGFFTLEDLIGGL